MKSRQGRYCKKLKQLERDADSNGNAPHSQGTRHLIQRQFHAEDAELYGPLFEKKGTMESISFRKKNDFALWEFSISKPEVFLVVIEQACEDDCGGEFEISIGSEQVKAEVKETHSKEAFIHHRVGHLRVTQCGQHQLKIAATLLRGNELMNLKSILFYQPDGTPSPSNQTQEVARE